MRIAKALRIPSGFGLSTRREALYCRSQSGHDLAATLTARHPSVAKAASSAPRAPHPASRPRACRPRGRAARSRDRRSAGRPAGDRRPAWPGSARRRARVARAGRRRPRPAACAARRGAVCGADEIAAALDHRGARRSTGAARRGRAVRRRSQRNPKRCESRS